MKTDIPPTELSIISRITGTLWCFVRRMDQMHLRWLLELSEAGHESEFVDNNAMVFVANRNTEPWLRLKSALDAGSLFASNELAEELMGQSRTIELSGHTRCLVGNSDISWSAQSPRSRHPLFFTGPNRTSMLYALLALVPDSDVEEVLRALSEVSPYWLLQVLNHGVSIPGLVKRNVRALATPQTLMSLLGNQDPFYRERAIALLGKLTT